MASESRDDRAVAVDLPPEVGDWLEEQAAALGVDRAELVVRLLAAHREAGSLDAGLDERLADVLDDRLEDAVGDRLEALLDERLGSAGESRLGSAIDEAVADRTDVVADAVAERLADDPPEEFGGDLESLREEFQAKIEDVRERVIQVKREADAKAPADHDHEEFRSLAELERRLDELAGDLDALGETVEAEVAAREDALAEREERLEDVEDKLRRVAWVVSDLKEETSGRDAHEEAVRRIKRAAAQEGVATAECERCGESVHVALLTDPECPHCQATVADVRPEGGFFRTKARLVPAAQLESGEPGPDDGE